MRRNAFTLIELLIVVAIIVVLIGILLPVLGAAKKAAYRASTQSELSQISTAIDTYYNAFSAYPGPGSIADTAGGGGGATKCMSGAQNLLLGLSYAFVPAKTGAAVQIPFNAGPAYADPNKPNGPIDYSQPNPIVPSTFKQVPQYVDITAKNITPPSGGTAPNATWPAAGIAGAGTTLGTDIAFPTFVDTFPDALPILYYRRTPGVENNIPQLAYGGTANPAAYYFNENAEYLASGANTAVLTSTSGATCPQYTNGFQASDLDGLAQAPGSPGNARGGYVLISAGIDRFYGHPANSSGVVNAALPSDDPTVVGGN